MLSSLTLQSVFCRYNTSKNNHLSIKKHINFHYIVSRGTRRWDIRRCESKYGRRENRPLRCEDALQKTVEMTNFTGKKSEHPNYVAEIMLRFSDFYSSFGTNCRSKDYQIYLTRSNKMELKVIDALLKYYI